MKKTIIAAAALVAMTACNQSLIEVPQAQYGFIDFGIAADTEMAVTKALTEMNSDALAAYNVTLKQGADVIWSKEYSAIDPGTDLKQPAGTYQLYVENLTEAEAAPQNAKGSVRVAREASVEVKAGISTSVKVECKPINSMVTVAYGENFTGVFSDPKVTVSDATRAFDMEWGHKAENAVYYSAGKAISWNLTVKMADGTSKTYASTKTTTTAAAQWTQINFSSSSTDGTITVTISVDNEITDTVTVTETIDPLGGNSAN